MGSTGTRGGCPVCKAALAVAPSELIAERQCPRCAAALWALNLPSGPLFCVRRPGQSSAEFIAELAGRALGLSAREAASLLIGADSLDLTELLAELDAAVKPMGE
jgi:hypothetical protein